MTRRTLVLVPLALSAALASPPDATAQHADPSRSVFVAVPDAYPDVGVPSTALVFRTATEDVILLDPAAPTPESLAAAAYILGSLRREELTPSQPRVHAVHGFILPEEGKQEALGRMRAMIRRLESRPSARLGNLGSGRWIRYGAG